MTAGPVVVHVPGPVVPYTRRRRGSSAKRTQDGRYEAWLAEARLACRRAMAGRECITGPLTVSIAVSPRGLTAAFHESTLTRPGDVSRGDLDNQAKAILDAANRVVYVDDRQVTSLTAAFVTGDGRLRTLEELLT